MRQFLLIDGVLRQNALQWIYQSGDVREVEPIYMGSRWDEAKDLGPILVEPESGAVVLSDIRHNRALQSQASLLTSEAPLHTVAEHLRHFTTVTDNYGSQSLLRFADPLVTWHWLDSYSQQSYGALLGPIATWQVAVQPPSWAPSGAIQWRHYQALPGSTILDGHSLNHLADEQVEALERAYRQRFLERLYDWLAREYPQALAKTSELERGIWLEQRLSEASAWGLINERSIAIWFERCACWGSDFATRVDSPYQDWLRDNPEAQKLPPEMRIQALDDSYLQS